MDDTDIFVIRLLSRVHITIIPIIVHLTTKTNKQKNIQLNNKIFKISDYYFQKFPQLLPDNCQFRLSLIDKNQMMLITANKIITIILKFTNW